MTEKRIPKVRIGDAWVPAHRIWKVVETITTATDLVERFNETREPLTTPMTQDVVAKVRARIREMELQMGGEGALQAAAAEAASLEAAARAEAMGRGSNELAEAGEGGPRGSTEVTPAADSKRRLSDEDFAEAARQLLAAMPLEDALRMLEDDYDNQVDIRELVRVVGKDVYLETLGREASELVANMIGPDQVATLWNESGFPSPIGGLWTTEDVERLLG